MKVGDKIICKKAKARYDTTVGSVYIIEKIDYYVRIRNDIGQQLGFPIRKIGDKIYNLANIKIAYFDLYFYSIKDIRKLKLDAIDESR